MTMYGGKATSLHYFPKFGNDLKTEFHLIFQDVHATSGELLHMKTVGLEST